MDEQLALTTEKLKDLESSREPGSMTTAEWQVGHNNIGHNYIGSMGRMAGDLGRRAPKVGYAIRRAHGGPAINNAHPYTVNPHGGRATHSRRCRFARPWAGVWSFLIFLQPRHPWVAPSLRPAEMARVTVGLCSVNLGVGRCCDSMRARQSNVGS